MQLPWLVAAVLAFVLLFLITLGWWRSSGVGPQVQVPMFYDAHYLFPRAWTQEQAAPGIPEPAPFAFFGPNRVSQSFVSGSDRLSMIEIWLAGQDNESVSVSLADDQGGSVSGDIVLNAGSGGESYRVSFEPFLEAKDRRFTLSMSAANATVEKPVVTHVVGGDRLNGSLSLNEYDRPGNLALATYANGLPGIWWLEAVGEQLLPAAFRLRMQQYKPPLYKGVFFPLLLLITVVLSVVYLVLARPQANPSLSQLSKALGWTLVLILSLFLIWQLVDGRVKLRLFLESIALENGDGVIAKAPPPGSPARLMKDLSADLWTAERYPEERFVSSELVEGMPAIRVPADSRLEYSLDVPPGAQFRTGIVGIGAGEFNAEVSVGSESVLIADVPAVGEPRAEDITWFEIDLTPWSGQPISLNLETESKRGDLDGLWIMPQVETSSEWLLADPLPPAIEIEGVSFYFGDVVELIGFNVLSPDHSEGEPAQIRLYWRLLQDSGAHVKVFVHLLDDKGQLVAQHDAQPVNNAYPLAVWQEGTIIVDEHILELAADLPGGMYEVAVGLYDPVSLMRWPVSRPDGTAVPEGRVILSTAVEVSP